MHWCCSTFGKLLALFEDYCDEENSNMYVFNYRILLQEKRNCLLMQLEEATRLTSYLHSQLKR